MIFDEKLKQHFINFSLELTEPPTQNLIYLYADYVELVSLFSNQNYVSSTDILDRFKDEGIIRQKERDNEQAEYNDENERFVESIFRVLNERAYMFSHDYPFMLRNQDKIILRKSEDINEKQKVYIFLLLSSSLNLFKLFQSELTTEFEMVCFHVLKNFLPSHALVKSFGKNSEYKGRAVEKIKLLANDLKISLESNAFDEISEKGMQEKGLDLIGWIPFDDTVPNFLSILCQCACGKEWFQKKGETARYNNFFKFHRLNPIHSMFIPFCLVNNMKNVFFKNYEIDNHLFFERKRILNYLHDTNFFSLLDSYKLVEKCISFEEEIV